MVDGAYNMKMRSVRSIDGLALEEECDLSTQASPVMHKLSKPDLDIPSFLRKNRKESGGRAPEEVRKPNKEVLKERVDEYYKEFISKNEKSILTFLL